jgi:hypothetical protein
MSKRWIIGLAALVLALSGTASVRAASSDTVASPNQVQPFCSGSTNSVTVSPSNQTLGKGQSLASFHVSWHCGVAGFFSSVYIQLNFGDGTAYYYTCQVNCGAGAFDQTHTYSVPCGNSQTFYVKAIMTDSDDNKSYTSNTASVLVNHLFC